MAVKEQEFRMLSVRLPEEIHQWLDQESERQRRTKSEIIRYALLRDKQRLSKRQDTTVSDVLPCPTP
jgi:Arc/MetJ-type ribon-helix-helix transcriptional regulator